EISRFPRKERLHMPGSSTTPGRSDLAMVRPKRVAFRTRNGVGTRGLAFAAQWLAYALPYRRFVAVLADANARLGADVDRYSFIVVDLHHLLLAGLPAHFESFSIGAGWCQALSDCSVDPGFRCHSQGPRFSSGSALWPSHDGIRRMRWTNLTIRPCRKSYGRYQTRNGLASSIVPAGTSFHRSAEFRFSSCSIVRTS